MVSQLDIDRSVVRGAVPVDGLGGRRSGLNGDFCAWVKMSGCVDGRGR